MPFDRTIFDQNLQSLADSSQTTPRDIFLTAKAIKEVELTELYTLINDKSKYLGEVASEAEMLALSGNKADWVIRTDTTETWIITGDDPSLITSWTKLAATNPVIGDNQKEFVGIGQISAGDIVSINNDGTIEKTVENVFPPATSTITTNNSGSDPYNAISLHNYANNSIITINKTLNQSAEVFVGTFSEGTLTNNSFGNLLDPYLTALTAVYDSNANRLLVAYIKNGDGVTYPTKGITIDVGELDYGSNSINWTTYRTWLFELPDPNHGLQLSYDYNNNIPILLVYRKYNYGIENLKAYQLDTLNTSSADAIIKNADSATPSNHTLVLDPSTNMDIMHHPFIDWEFVPSISAIFYSLSISSGYVLFAIESTSTGMSYLGKKTLTNNNATTGFVREGLPPAITFNDNDNSLLVFGNAGNVPWTDILGAALIPIDSWLTTTNPYIAIKSSWNSNGPLNVQYNSVQNNYFFVYSESTSLYVQTGEIINGALEIHDNAQELYQYSTVPDSNASLTSFMYGTDKTQPDKLITNNKYKTQYTTFTAGYSTTNANEWIGIAYTSNSDTQNVIVSFPGAIDNNQTGLVKDTIYYVSANGTLSTTKTEYGMLGKAISDTDLQIFGNTPNEFLNSSDIDFTNIDNKSVLTKVSNTTYEFRKSSADTSQEYTAYENISAGDLVSLRNDNTVELLKPNITLTNGTEVNPSQFFEMGEYYLLTDKTNNRLVAIDPMADNSTDGHNQAGYIQFLEVTNNTVQELSNATDPVSPWITTGGTASTGHSAVWIEHLSKGLIIYSNSGIHWKLFDYNNNQVNILATGTFTTNEEWYLDACYDETTGKVFVVRAYNSPSMMDTDQFAVHIMTVAADNTVTIQDGWQAIGQGLLNNFHYQIPKITYNPDLNQLYVFFYELGSSYYRLWVTDLTESIGFDTMSPMLTTVFTTQVLYSDLTNDGRGIHFLYHKLQKKLILWGHKVNGRSNLTVISNLSNLTTSSPTEFQNGDLVFTDHRFEDQTDTWWKGCEYDSNNGLLYISQTVSNTRKLYIVEVKGDNSINILDTQTIIPTTESDQSGYSFGMSYNPNTNKLALFYDIDSSPSTPYYRLDSLNIIASGDFFGIAEDNISANSNGTINLPGSVNRSQQGLIANTPYYLSPYGLITNISSEGKFLGNALSSTELYLTVKSITKEAYSTDTFVGDGSNSQFTVKPNHNEHSILVFYNGICLVPGSDYTHSPDLIQLTFVPVNQSDIVIRYLPI